MGTEVVEEPEVVEELGELAPGGEIEELSAVEGAPVDEVGVAPPAADSVTSSDAPGQRTSLRIWLAMAGVLSLITGLIVLTQPKDSGDALALGSVVVLGMFALALGVASAFAGLLTSGITGWSRLLRVVVGVLTAVSGILVAVNLPTEIGFFVWFVVVMIGLTWVGEGALTLVGQGQSLSMLWTRIFGAVSVAAGLALAVSPATGAAMWWVAGAAAVIWGVAELTTAGTRDR